MLGQSEFAEEHFYLKNRDTSIRAQYSFPHRNFWHVRTLFFSNGKMWFLDYWQTLNLRWTY